VVGWCRAPRAPRWRARRARRARSTGASALAHLFTPCPDGAEAIARGRGRARRCASAARQRGGRLADYVVSHAGATAFPRSFQLLADGGTLTFYGASSGYHFTFVGKRGRAPAERVLRAQARAPASRRSSTTAPPATGDGLTDAAGLELIEAARAAGLRLCVAAYTDAQRDFVLSLGFGDAVRGVVSLEELARRGAGQFEWPSALPPLPDPRRDTVRFREAVRLFQERTVKPFGQAVGRVLRGAGRGPGRARPRRRARRPRRARRVDVARPAVHRRVVYAEDMAGRRYSFYAPQVWTRQRRILMPTARSSARTCATPTRSRA
jgi:acrylyl-CoA reductase (NADPH)/3-hydroxypropionyl-CoA dehydratase/3-hydroxypropionyl-CoA synthetase